MLEQLTACLDILRSYPILILEIMIFRLTFCLQNCYGLLRSKLLLWYKERFQDLREGGVQSTFFCIFNHYHFISCPNKLKICHIITQLYIQNIMQKHQNNALQKEFHNQFKQVLFLSNKPHARGTLDMSMG